MLEAKENGIWASLTQAKLWWPDDWVRASPKLQLLWGVPGLQWSVSIKRGPRKEQWWSGIRVMGDQGSFMHVGREGWLAWSDPTDELLLLKLLKKLMLVLIERCQNTQCNAVCCVWGCIAVTSQDAHADPCPPLKTPATGTLTSELDHGAMEGGLVWWITFSFTSRGWPGACM